MDITTVFGTVILGSSPGRGTLKAERINVPLSTLGERAYRTRTPEHVLVSKPKQRGGAQSKPSDDEA